MRLKFYATYIANDGSIDTEEAESTVSDLAKNDENGILVVSTSADMDNLFFSRYLPDLGGLLRLLFLVL